MKRPSLIVLSLVPLLTLELVISAQPSSAQPPALECQLLALSSYVEDTANPIRDFNFESSQREGPEVDSENEEGHRQPDFDDETEIQYTEVGKVSFDELKAKTLYDEKQLSELETYCQEILSKSSRHPSALFYRGICHFNRANYQQALKDFNRCLKEARWPLSVHNWIIETSKKLKNPRLGLMHVTKAIELGAKDLSHFRDQGYANEVLKHWAESAESFSAALEIEPTDHPSLTHRALAYAKLKKYQLALKDLNAALDIIRNDSKNYFMRSQILNFLGQKQKALEDLNKSLQIDSRYAKAYLFRSHIYEELGEKRLAKRDYERAMAIDPHLSTSDLEI